MRTINLIVIHCSATKVTRNFTVADLEACHKSQGWSGIGYHYYITKDGQLHQTRPEDVPGIHAKRYANGQAADTRTPAQKHTLLNLLRSLKYDYPGAKILGHRDLPWVKKDCPCFDAQSEYSQLNGNQK